VCVVLAINRVHGRLQTQVNLNNRRGLTSLLNSTSVFVVYIFYLALVLLIYTKYAEHMFSVMMNYDGKHIYQQVVIAMEKCHFMLLSNWILLFVGMVRKFFGSFLAEILMHKVASGLGGKGRM
jgi:hypothetical protein